MVAGATMIMKTRLALWLSVLSLLTFGSFCLARAQHSGRPSSEDEIRHFIEKYDIAWNHKDPAALKLILAADYVYFGSKGDIRSRQSLLDEFMSPKYQLDSAERSELNVYVTSGTAVVSSRWKGHGTYDGQEFNDDQRCSLALARKKADWLVASEHCTQIAHRTEGHDQPLSWRHLLEIGRPIRAPAEPCITSNPEVNENESPVS